MIATGGGAFDPQDRPLYFTVRHPSHGGESPYLTATNDLFGDAEESYLAEHLDHGVTVLLDSGIFHLSNDYARRHRIPLPQALGRAPEEMDGFDRLYARYVYLARTYGDRLWGYIELDQGGEDNKRRTRQRLHDEGLSPIPVYHPLGDSWDYFDELAETYDRICVGNIVQLASPSRVRLLHTLWERHRRYPDLWVHMLGLMPNQWLLPLPAESADSSTMLSGLRYPNVALGHTHMEAYGSNTNPAFRPVMRHRPGYRSGQVQRALQMYLDEVAYQGLLWRQIRADEDATFGPINRMPPIDPAEGLGRGDRVVAPADRPT